MTLLDPIPEGPPVSARNGHEPQHDTAPTWCKHCGKFVQWWGPEDGSWGICPNPGERLFDSETREGRRKIMEVFGC